MKRRKLLHEKSKNAESLLIIYSYIKNKLKLTSVFKLNVFALTLTIFGSKFQKYIMKNKTCVDYFIIENFIE